MTHNTTMPDHIRAAANDRLCAALRRLGACPESLEWITNQQFATIQEAWDECTRADWMLCYYLWQNGTPSISHEFYEASFQYLWKETGSAIDIQPWITRACTIPSNDRNLAVEFRLEILTMVDNDPDQESRRQKLAVAYAIASYAIGSRDYVFGQLHHEYFYDLGPHHACDKEWADIVRKHFPTPPTI